MILFFHLLVNQNTEMPLFEKNPLHSHQRVLLQSYLYRKLDQLVEFRIEHLCNHQNKCNYLQNSDHGHHILDYPFGRLTGEFGTDVVVIEPALPYGLASPSIGFVNRLLQIRLVSTVKFSKILDFRAGSKFAQKLLQGLSYD